jgi:hypothetical protein
MLTDKIISFVKDVIERPSHIKVEMIINMVTVDDAALLKNKFGVEVEGYTRKVDNFGVIHTYKNHGNPSKEEKRGQVAVVTDDFALIVEITKAENAVEISKNKLGRDCIIYSYINDSAYYYVEEIRTGKKELVLNTMYKIKPPRKNGAE